jgi:DNA-nicking Smr family endonuclease
MGHGGDGGDPNKPRPPARRRRRGALSDEDRALWSRIAETATPLNPEPRRPRAEAAPAPDPRANAPRQPGADAPPQPGADAPRQPGADASPRDRADAPGPAARGARRGRGRAAASAAMDADVRATDPRDRDPPRGDPSAAGPRDRPHAPDPDLPRDGLPPDGLPRHDPAADADLFAAAARVLRPRGRPEPPVRWAPHAFDRPAPVARNTPGLDRGTARRLGRGRMEPQARLDLHGMTADRAHAALTGFILRARADGLRCVLVVTGKGRAEDGRHGHGVLRRDTPRWLSVPPLADCVIGVFGAHARHGGGGALYVYLRRIR